MATNINASTSAIAASVKDYILEAFLPGTNPSELTETTPLVTGGILDSLATVQLISFLEERFGIEIQPHETGVDYLDTIVSITQLVQSKS